MKLVFIASQGLSRGVRGALTQWLVEIGPGVFVGRLPKRIISHLWAEVGRWCEGQGVETEARATLVEHDDSEQGYRLLVAGAAAYMPTEFTGLWLVTRTVATADPEEAGQPQETPESQQPSEDPYYDRQPW